jgi:hypothetical protein
VTAILPSLKPSSQSTNHFQIVRFEKVNKQLKEQYTATLSKYPHYIVQTGYNDVQPYGRDPKIDNTSIIPSASIKLSSIKQEPSSQQLTNPQISLPMEIQANDSGDDSDCMIVDD